MSKKFFISALTSFILILMIGLPTEAYAIVGQYNVIDERSSYASKYSSSPSYPYTDVSGIGFGGNAYRAYASIRPTVYNTATWRCKTSYPADYRFHTYMAVPGQSGTIDGYFRYTVHNTNITEDFQIWLNQENHYNKWVYLGWSLGKGGINDTGKCYVSTNSDDYYNNSGTSREFWVDHMKYYPSGSNTPPAYTHGW